MSKHHARVCAALAFVAFIIRASIVLARPIDVLDRMFVPDDAYYTLAIARSMARGLGPTIDGVHLTNGFQPLIAFLLVPFVRLCELDEVALRSALLIGAVADAISVWLLGRIVFRVSSSPIAAIIASGLWAFSTAAIATSLNGLESSLAVTCTLVALFAFSRAASRPTTSAYAWCGAALGLCLLARVDSVFFVATMGIVIFLRTGIRAAMTSAIGALVVVLPWWSYSAMRFGAVIPESGAAVREQTLMYKALGIVVRDQVAWASGAVVGPPLFDSTTLREFLGSTASGVGFVLGIVIVVAMLYFARRVASDAVRIYAIYASCIFLFYALYLPATWFFRRYLLPVQVLTTIAIALLGGKLIPSRWRLRIFYVVIALCGVALLARLTLFMTYTSTLSLDQGHHGVKGYGTPAKTILAMSPRGAVIGSFQSGALAWFAHESGSERNVVNLDGVVDGEAARAVREHRIAAFARSRGVTHLADWDVNVNLFLDRSGDARITRSSLHAIGAAERQGDGEVFVLYEIAWPPPPDADGQN